MTLISAPAEIDMDARQGSPFIYALQFFEDLAATQPYDFTGWTFQMQLREGVADSGAPTAFVVSSGSGGQISFIGEATDGSPDPNGTPDPTNGWIYINIPSIQTATLSASKPPKTKQYPVVATFYYDLEGTPPGGETQALAYGNFLLTCEVTRG